MSRRDSRKRPPCDQKPPPLVNPSISTMAIAGDICRLNPYGLMRQWNCKPSSFSPRERYPSIRPPVSRCSHCQTLKWLEESMKQEGCFDPKPVNDALGIWQRSPHKKTLGYYGIGNPNDKPEAESYNKSLKSSLELTMDGVPRMKARRPSEKLPLKPPKPAPVCQPYILNPKALQAELKRMPTIKQKLRPSEAFSALFCRFPINPKDPLGVKEARTKAREEAKAKEKLVKSPKHGKHWYCPPKCGETETKCTDYEWAKYKLDSKPYDEAFQQWFKEQTLGQPDQEPLNYDDLYKRLQACFEIKPRPDPECMALVECCPGMKMPGGGSAGDGTGGGSTGGGAGGGTAGGGAGDHGEDGKGGTGKDGQGDGAGADKDKDRYTNDKNKDKDKNRGEDTHKDKDKDKNKDKDTDKDKDKNKDKDTDKDKNKDKDKYDKDTDKNKDKDKVRDKETDKDKDKDKNKDKNKDKDKDKIGDSTKDNNADKGKNKNKDKTGKEDANVDEGKNKDRKKGEDESDKDKSKQKTGKDKNDKKKEGDAEKDKWGKDKNKDSTNGEEFNKDKSKQEPGKDKKKEGEESDKDKSQLKPDKDKKDKKKDKSSEEHAKDKSKLKPGKKPKLPQDMINDLRLTDASDIPNDLTQRPPSLEAPQKESLMEDDYIWTWKLKEKLKKPRKKRNKSKPKSATPVGDKDKDKDKNQCPPCPPEGCPCAICRAVYAKPVEDRPFMKDLLRQEKERKLREYLRNMRHAEYLKCGTSQGRAPLHRVDPITCDDSFCRNPKLGEYCDCLGALQRLQVLLDKRRHPLINRDLNLNLTKLRSRIARRLCESIEA